MNTWVTIHERRRKPDAKPKPDPAVLSATDTYYSHALDDARGLDALKNSVDWVRARRPHLEGDKDAN